MKFPLKADAILDRHQCGPLPDRSSDAFDHRVLHGLGHLVCEDNIIEQDMLSLVYCLDDPIRSKDSVSPCRRSQLEAVIPDDVVIGAAYNGHPGMGMKA